MIAYIVSQWNGMDYDDSDVYVAGVFASYEEAYSYCKNTPAYRAYPSYSQMTAAEAYNIQKWVDTNMVECYNGEGVKE